jgi:hypothetical protein
VAIFAAETDDKLKFVGLVSSVRQHRFHALLICGRNQTINVEQSFPLVAFFRQNMTGMRMTAFDLAGRSQAKSFRRTLMCF